MRRRFVDLTNRRRFKRKTGKPKLNMTIADAPIKTATQSPRARRRSIGELLAPLDKIAATSPNLVANYEAQFESGGERYELPRYLFVGPKGGDTPV